MHSDEYSILKNAPEHEIQADEAWDEMLKLLDEQMPVNKAGKRMGGSFSAFIVALAVAAAGLSISALFLLQPFDHSKPSKDSKPVSDSLPVKILAAHSAEEDVESRRADTISSTSQPLALVYNNENYVATKDPDQTVSADTVRTAEQAENSLAEQVQTQDKLPEMAAMKDEPTAKRVDKEDHAKAAEDTFTISSEEKTLSVKDENTERKTEKWKPQKTKFHLNAVDFSGLKNGVNNVFDAVANTAGIITDNMHFGLGWTANLPLNGTQYYWYGISGQSKPYLSLIPSVWISKSFNDRTSLTVDFNFCKMRNGSTVTSSGGGQQSGADTIQGSPAKQSEQSPTQVLIRLRTIQISPELNYRLNEKWSLSAGINYGIINGVLIGSEFTDSTGISGRNLVRLNRNDSLMTAIRASVMDIKAGVDYQFKRARVGVEFSVPIRNSSTNKQLKVQPFSVDFYLRFMIK
jgi:hypothetical protein